MTAYSRGVALFRGATRDLTASELLLPVPSCPGWTVSDVVTHVLDQHEHALGPMRAAEADHGDLMAAYAVAIPDDPALAAGATVETLDLTVHAWDVAVALGADLRLGDDQLTFLEVLAREAGDRLYVEDAFVRPTGADADPEGLDRQGLALLPYGRRAPA